MSGMLLKEIRQIDRSAADVLERADFRTDSEIKSLTREDLYELFREPEKLKLRRTIFETINKHNPVNRLFKDLQGFIPHDFLRDALSNDGVLVDYLSKLKDVKTQLDYVQNFISAHIDFLENNSTQPYQEPYREKPRTNTCTSNSSESIRNRCGQNETSAKQDPVIPKYQPPSSSRLQRTQVTVNYRMVKTGKTFNADEQILNQIQAFNPDLELVNVEENQSGGGCHILLVFCPIVSRIGTDVEAAMRSVTGNEPVILVLMHHCHEAKHVVSMRTWADNKKIALHVNVFYHEKLKGLLTCKQNEDAVSAIRTELQKHGKKEEITQHFDDSHAVGYSSNRSVYNYTPSSPKNITNLWGMFSK